MIGKIGKQQTLIIHWTWTEYKKSTIQIEADGFNDDDFEAIGYLLVEAMGQFLSSARKVLPNSQKKLYNEYVKDLHDYMEKILITNYEDV